MPTEPYLYDPSSYTLPAHPPSPSALSIVIAVMVVFEVVLVGGGFWWYSQTVEKHAAEIDELTRKHAAEVQEIGAKFDRCSERVRLLTEGTEVLEAEKVGFAEENERLRDAFLATNERDSTDAMVSNDDVSENQQLP